MRDELAVYRQCVADFRALVARFPQLMVPANQTRFSSYIRKQMYTQGYVMPPKDYRTMGEDLVNIAVRIPASVMGEIDAHVERLRVASRWAKVGRSDALRDLILRALDSLATPVSVSPQPMPPTVSPQPEPTIAPGAGDNSEQIETIIATPENNYYEQIETVLPGDMPQASIRAQQATAASKADKATVEARIHQLREQGLSYTQIAAQLQAEGMPTMSGRGTWAKGNVERILSGRKTAVKSETAAP